ncbi:IS110 family transposase [Dactylosporangium vinaceum]|uniref:IS110 family transposase n=1 Tax=Dactylosporangium vinaceum TaxID=53362 RepID=UPI001CA94EE0|nr:IS110 family transposase [Dactylosporangium vinaceum]UAB96986.1 IS110 family transposase [Dactylosporangium vinaceum]
MPIEAGQPADSRPDRRRWVVGVDTHTDTHAAALVDALGEVHAQTEVSADPDGYIRLLAWAGEHLPAGQRMFWAVEGTRAHGHGLTRVLQAAGHQVIEAVPPVRGSRRRGGKSDRLDAIHAARTALINDHPATPRADGPREALRLLVTARQHYSTTRTATINVFKSVILGATELREQLRHLLTAAQIRTVLTLPEPETADVEERIRLQQLQTLAQTVTDLNAVLAANYQQLEDLVRQLCPALLDLPGVGPQTAAVALTAWSHHTRLRDEAAFAALAGAAPLPASSGRHQRHRLNRGGDRTLNAALHTIVTTRRRMKHPATSAYIARRTAEGLTPKEVLRCLKRYTARQLFRLMQTTAPATT